MYYDFHQSVRNIAGHRVLAVNRGEREGFLKVTIEADPVKAQRIVAKAHVRNNSSACCEAVRTAALDA